MVSGHDGVKARLRRAAQAILAGRLRGVPMGYLIAGPVGSAKTFLVNCFTGEIGFPCVKFLNFRSQWQGVTEGNLEKILKLLHAMWPVGVIIDEADAFLGDRNQQGDSGTSNRVFAQLASFMGNTEYRGKIVWFLITSPARPAAHRPEAAGPRRGAPGALLSADRRGARRAVPDHAEEERASTTPVTSIARGDRRSRRPVGRRHRGDPGARAPGRRRRRRRHSRWRRVDGAAARLRRLHSGDQPARTRAADSRRRAGVHLARGAARAVSRDGSRRRCSRASTSCARCSDSLTLRTIVQRRSMCREAPCSIPCAQRASTRGPRGARAARRRRRSTS